MAEGKLGSKPNGMPQLGIPHEGSCLADGLVDCALGPERQSLVLRRHQLAWSMTWMIEGPQATMSPCRMLALVPMPWSCGAGNGGAVRGSVADRGCLSKGRSPRQCHPCGHWRLPAVKRAGSVGSTCGPPNGARNPRKGSGLPQRLRQPPIGIPEGYQLTWVGPWAVICKGFTLSIVSLVGMLVPGCRVQEGHSAGSTAGGRAGGVDGGRAGGAHACKLAPGRQAGGRAGWAGWLAGAGSGAGAARAAAALPAAEPNQHALELRRQRRQAGPERGRAALHMGQPGPLTVVAHQGCLYLRGIQDELRQGALVAQRTGVDGGIQCCKGEASAANDKPQAGRQACRRGQRCRRSRSVGTSLSSSLLPSFWGARPTPALCGITVPHLSQWAQAG